MICGIFGFDVSLFTSDGTVRNGTSSQGTYTDTAQSSSSHAITASSTAYFCVLSVLLSPRIQDPLCFYRLSARSSCWSSGPWQLSPLIGESGPPSTQPANTSHGLPLEPHNTEIETEALLITVHPGRLSILDILVAARPWDSSTHPPRVGIRCLPPGCVQARGLSLEIRNSPIEKPYRDIAT